MAVKWKNKQDLLCADLALLLPAPAQAMPDRVKFHIVTCEVATLLYVLGDFPEVATLLSGDTRLSRYKIVPTFIPSWQKALHPARISRCSEKCRPFTSFAASMPRPVNKESRLFLLRKGLSHMCRRGPDRGTRQSRARHKSNYR